MHITQQNLLGIMQYIRADRDFIIVIDGGEGKGKSSLALEIAAFCEEGKFDISKVAFTETDVYRVLYEIEKYHVVIIDEGENVLFSRESMRRLNRELIKTIMSITRKKNIIIIINIPDFLMLDKYIKTKRVGLWLHVTRRGLFKFYNANKARTYAKNADKTKKGKRIPLPEPDFIDTFEKVEGETWDKYVARKIKKGDEDIQKKLLMAERSENELLTIYEAAIFLGTTEDQILDWIQMEKLSGEKDEDNNWRIPLKEVMMFKEDIKKNKRNANLYELYKKKGNEQINNS